MQTVHEIMNDNLISLNVTQICRVRNIFRGASVIKSSHSICL